MCQFCMIWIVSCDCFSNQQDLTVFEQEYYRAWVWFSLNIKNKALKPIADWKRLPKNTIKYYPLANSKKYLAIANFIMQKRSVFMTLM